MIQPGETHEAFAKKIGVERNTITQYFNGNRIPTSAILFQICKNCNVSADWLLGLSDVKSPDMSLRALCKRTGLSEKSLEYLISNAKILAQTKLIDPNTVTVDQTTEGINPLTLVIDALLSTDPKSLDSFLNTIYNYLHVKENYDRFNKNSTDCEGYVEVNGMILLNAKETLEHELILAAKKLIDLLPHIDSEKWRYFYAQP